ncbi:MAG: hypothetical protein EXR98_01880 [Gemmataceae bacterium]|nr:hypothetical protein [Gemmataceae bacterium]
MQARSFSAPLTVLLLLASGTMPGCNRAEQPPKQDPTQPLPKEIVAAPAGAGQPPKQDPPQPLPKEIVGAWQKAGAEAGWVGLASNGGLDFQDKATGLADAVPAFLFSWKDGVVAKLPVPAAPFGLILGGTEVTDAGLKELASLKSLHTLDLSGMEVTDAGLKELAGLKSLHTLDLSGMEVTDAGVAELRKALPDCKIIR